MGFLLFQQAVGFCVKELMIQMLNEVCLTKLCFLPLFWAAVLLLRKMKPVSSVVIFIALCSVGSEAL